MTETLHFVDDMYEPAATPDTHEDTLAARLFAIKPPGKGDSGMAEEHS